MPRDLKKLLDGLYESYDFNSRRAHDPISFPHRYKRKEDMEVAGFIASCYAYGSVKLFMPVIERILDRMGQSPAEFAASFDAGRDAALFEKGFGNDKDAGCYRFYIKGDLFYLLTALKHTLNKHGSLEGLFMNGFRDSDPDVGKALHRFMLQMKEASLYTRPRQGSGYAFYFPSAGSDGSCKRGCLFLRWMVRNSDIDFGLWRGVPKNKLIIPLDTHIARISECLKLIPRKQNNWKTAVKITDALKALDPSDPLKYDFALCHKGISGECEKSRCRTCAIRSSDT